MEIAVIVVRAIAGWKEARELETRGMWLGGHWRRRKTHSMELHCVTAYYNRISRGFHWMQKAKYWEPTAPQQFEVLLHTCQEATAILGGEADGGIDVDGGFEGLPTGILPYNPCPLPS